MSPDEHPADPAALRGEVLTAAAQQPAPGRAEPTRGVLCLTFDVDAESVMLAADPANEARASLMSHQAYGPLVGVPAGGVSVLTMHPFLSGRPARAAALEALIERALASPGLSVARLRDLLRQHEDAPGAEDSSGSLTSGR